MSYEPQQPRPDYRSDGGYGPGRPDPRSAQYQGDPRTGSSGPQDDEKTVAVLTHLSGPIAAIVSVGWLGFLGPLIVWFIYKDKSPFLRAASAGAFNFNVAFSILYIVGWVLAFTLVGIPVALVLWAVIFLVAAWCHVKGALRAARGESYDYPFQIRILN